MIEKKREGFGVDFWKKKKKKEANEKGKLKETF